MYGNLGNSAAQDPRELEMLAREEQDRREALAAARDRNMTDDGVIPSEHHELIHKLEAEWKEAVERLERARKS